MAQIAGQPWELGTSSHHITTQHTPIYAVYTKRIIRWVCGSRNNPIHAPQRQPHICYGYGIVEFLECRHSIGNVLNWICARHLWWQQRISRRSKKNTLCIIGWNLQHYIIYSYTKHTSWIIVWCGHVIWLILNGDIEVYLVGRMIEWGKMEEKEVILCRLVFNTTWPNLM